MILTNQGIDKIHAIIINKFHKYPLTTIPKHVNILAKENNSHYMRLINMTPHGSYIIKIHIRTMTMFNISQEQND